MSAQQDTTQKKVSIALLIHSGLTFINQLTAKSSAMKDMGSRAETQLLTFSSAALSDSYQAS